MDKALLHNSRIFLPVWEAQLAFMQEEVEEMERLGLTPPVPGNNYWEREISEARDLIAAAEKKEM